MTSVTLQKRGLAMSEFDECCARAASNFGKLTSNDVTPGPAEAQEMTKNPCIDAKEAA